MKLFARLHLFLIIAILILAILTVGVFWEAPFQTTPPPQGIAAIFFQAWGYVVVPIRFVIDKLSAAHVDASPTVTIMILVAYLAILVLVDIVIAKLGGDAAEAD